MSHNKRVPPSGQNLLHGGSVTSVVPQILKQGYIGDMHEKSVVELMELLERQEKLLKNRKFLEKLPDKGEKIEKFAKELQDLISLKKQEKTDSVEPEKLTKDTEEHCDVAQDDNDHLEKPDDHPPVEDNIKIIERGFNKMSIHEGPHYQVIVKAEERKKKSKFSLNRNLKTKESGTTPDKQTLKGQHKSPVKPTDLTSASVHDPDHGPAQMISVEECRDLYSSQKKKMQASRAEQLADRLLRRMRMVTPIEHPEGRYKAAEEKNQDGLTLDSEGLVEDSPG